LQELLDAYFSDDITKVSQKGDGGKCQTCQKETKIGLTRKIVVGGDYLIIIPVRHVYQKKMNRSSKNCRPIHAQKVLDISNYMVNTKNGPIWYELAAVIVHHGTELSSGHYTCIVLNSQTVTVQIDDCPPKVTQVPNAAVDSVIGDGYIYVYKKMAVMLKSAIITASVGLGLTCFPRAAQITLKESLSTNPLTKQRWQTNP
jgi:ubiquitin C-terminal hydrolase